MSGKETQPVPRAFSAIGRYLVEPVVDQITQPQALEDRSKVGSKACGLLALPRSWTPPFFVLTVDLHANWLRAGKPIQMLTDAGHEIVAVCEAWQNVWVKGIILRSSAVAETLRDRGAYESCELPADFNAETIGKVIQQIYRAYESEGGDGSMAIIVQALAGGGTRGHVSNELRVAKSINHWMWEIEAPGSGTGRFNSQRSKSPDVNATLRSKSIIKEGFTASLQGVCRWLTTRHSRRSHIEWGLVGDRLWLFQIDFEDDLPDLGHDPRDLLRDADDAPSGVPAEGSPWKRVNSAQDTGWSKVDKVKVFVEDRLEQYPALYYLTAAEARSAIEAGYDLAADIERITHGRAVCRTDCKSPQIDRLNLPRTDSVSPEEAVHFIRQTTSALKTKGALENEICFILHKFIPAKVAAWTVARPDQQIVLVDTLWGLPDGLQFLPHDTFEVDVRRQNISSEFVRYKPQFLQETASGEWALKHVARKFARRRSLAVHHLRAIATETQRIAQKLKRPIQIMWFCDVAEAADVGRNVPWFMMPPEQPQSKAHTSLAPGLIKVVIKNFEDLETVRKLQPTKAILVLEPEAELYRDGEFLKTIVDVAVNLSLPVLMTGSVLGHAFYTLERGGVSVRTEAPSHSRVRQRQTFRKLVRDAIPSKIIDHGERVDQARIDKTESRAALVIKLFEESQELLNARSPDEVTAELADLTEVLRSLCAATGVDWDDVQTAAEQKRLSRGSFEQNVVLMETSWPRWTDENRSPETRMIPLSALGQITTNENEHTINFSAAAAKGADNLLTLTNGTKIRVSITKDGIQIAECDDRPTLDAQLKFDF